MSGKLNHKVFIPVTDDMLYDRPELITAPLRPYQVDNPCFHWMATIESPESADCEPVEIRRFDHTSVKGFARGVVRDLGRAAREIAPQPQLRAVQG